MSEQVYPSVFALSSLQETRAWVKANVKDTEVTVRRPFVMVSVEVVIGIGKWVYGVGFAKCAASDVWDVFVGTTLAQDRAVRDAAQQVYKHTLGYHVDEMKQAMSHWAKQAQFAVGQITEALKPFAEAMGKGTE